MIDEFIETKNMSAINETFEALHAHKSTLRPVLLPDFAERGLS